MAQREYGRHDNPIDWDAFDEADARAGHVEGAGFLRIVCWVIVVLAIAVVVYGGIQLKGAFDFLNAYTGNNSDIVSDPWVILTPVSIIALAVLTLIPASFGLQVASGTPRAVAPLVLGAIGVLLPLTSFLIAPYAGSHVYLWMLAEIPALAYIIALLRVRFSAHPSGGKTSIKDELWDEKNIWQ